MTRPPVEIELLLGRDGLFRRVPLASIAAVTRVPLSTLHENLSGLLLSFLTGDDKPARPPLGEPTERVGDEQSSTNEPNETQRKKVENEPIETERTRIETGRESPREGEPPTLDAPTLAALLHDQEHLRTYEALVLRHSPEELAKALAITLARPAGSIRTSRGAYFNGLLSTLAARRAGSVTPSAYAPRTPPPST